MLDGGALARARLPGLVERARRVAKARGRPPKLALLAFADASGGAPWVERKVRAGARAGVDVTPRILESDVTTSHAVRALAELVARGAPDALFLEFPFPAGVDGDLVCHALPEALDLDVMGPRAVAHYLAHADAAPPLTVAAALLLLDAGQVSVDGLRGVLVGEDIPFHAMFRLALARRGAVMAPLVSPDDPALEDRVAGAELLVVSAGRPGLVPADRLAAGTVVVDAGYFNPRGRGDLDTSGGVAHLGALAPVPGGVGPMTVSVLVERVIDMAERRA
jgi:methylenetetrahydrofolate dehydrogenase (NADP+) / methenyltetrahydrofolate cyclohydrolase